MSTRLIAQGGENSSLHSVSRAKEFATGGGGGGGGGAPANGGGAGGGVEKRAFGKDLGNNSKLITTTGAAKAATKAVLGDRTNATNNAAGTTQRLAAKTTQKQQSVAQTQPTATKVRRRISPLFGDGLLSVRSCFANFFARRIRTRHAQYVASVVCERSFQMRSSTVRVDRPCPRPL